MIGLGVGIPAALILGITAGFLFFGRRKSREEPAPAKNAYDPTTYTCERYPEKAELYALPVEMANNSSPRF